MDGDGWFIKDMVLPVLFSSIDTVAELEELGLHSARAFQNDEAFRSVVETIDTHYPMAKMECIRLLTEVNQQLPLHNQMNYT